MSRHALRETATRNQPRAVRANNDPVPNAATPIVADVASNAAAKVVHRVIVHRGIDLKAVETAAVVIVATDHAPTKDAVNKDAANKDAAISHAADKVAVAMIARLKAHGH